ncbi:hypothetical protein MMC07_009961 [Pseudocyphellaria aurata]|nr:hypothetical protein [Pseudocyphellaria aurata]
MLALMSGGKRTGKRRGLYPSARQLALKNVFLATIPHLGGHFAVYLVQPYENCWPTAPDASNSRLSRTRPSNLRLNLVQTYQNYKAKLAARGMAYAASMQERRQAASDEYPIEAVVPALRVAAGMLRRAPIPHLVEHIAIQLL